MGFLDQFPQKRIQCLSRTEICPWVRCKHHMIWWHYQVLPYWTDEQIFDWIDNLHLHCDCLLDIIDFLGILTYEQIGKAFNVSRQVPIEIEKLAVKKLRKHFFRQYKKELRKEGLSTTSIQDLKIPNEALYDIWLTKQTRPKNLTP